MMIKTMFLMTEIDLSQFFIKTFQQNIMTATMFEFLKDTKITHIITYVLVVAS